MRCMAIAVSGLAIGLLLTMGCGDRGATTPTVVQIPPQQPIDQVTVLSASPAQGAVLSRGTATTFAYKFSYELVGADTGMITLAIVDQDGRSLPSSEGSPGLAVTRGRGTGELSCTREIPASATAVRAFLPLFVGTSSTSRQMALVEYSLR